MEILLSMVQQTTDKFTEQGLFNSRNATDILQKHHPVSINKMTLRDLPNESGSIMKQPVTTVQSYETRTNSDPAKLVGAKRQQPDCSSSPTTRHQTPAANGSPGHLVYVRRKLETEHGKINVAPTSDAACSSGLRKSTNETPEKIELQQEQIGKSTVGATKKTEIQQEQNGKSTVGATKKTEIQQEQNWKSSNEVTEKTDIQKEQNGKSSNKLTEKTEVQEEQTGKSSDESIEKTEIQQEQTWKSKDGQSKTIDEAPRYTESHREFSSSYWTERFNRLQEFLQYLDQSGSKDYAEKFGTFSIEDLNKLAVNLEKRAIRLTLEEALLSQRAKDLNFLGRSSQ